MTELRENCLPRGDISVFKGGVGVLITSRNGLHPGLAAWTRLNLRANSCLGVGGGIDVGGGARITEFL